MNQPKHPLGPLSRVARGALGFAPPTAFRLSVLMPLYNERHLVEASLRRVLALRHELIRSLDVIVVDDASNDGSYEIVERISAEDDRVRLIQHDRNQGKGAAVRTALEHASGDITIVQDADLEYNPEDIPALLVPFAKEGADAVFGSRYMPSVYRRASMHRHTMINKTLTFVSNWFSDVHLTDLETGYKAVNTELLKSIPLRSNDFRFEVELAFKLAKRRARIFEVPIRYLPRTYEEGKKIRARDAALAIAAMMQYWAVDDIYGEDEYGSNILVDLEAARKFNVWMASTLRQFIGNRVLEIGAGIGNLTKHFIPRDTYTVSDINYHYLRYLHSYSHGKPYMSVLQIDAGRPEDFAELEEQFDTVLMVNVLEHVSDPNTALQNIRSVLECGGRAVILVPQHPGLYGTLDTVLGHRERYTAKRLTDDLTENGFQVETVFDFNRCSVPGWWVNGKVLRRTAFSKVQLKLVNTALPILKHIDRSLPWSGLSLIAVARKIEH
jgi:glycosyltransferase involved in cell wall biosynthesis